MFAGMEMVQQCQDDSSPVGGVRQRRYKRLLSDPGRGQAFLLFYFHREVIYHS